MTAVAATWTPSDQFGMWQLVVGVIGLAFAGWQLWLARRAVQATQRTVQTTANAVTRQLLANDLLLLLPEIHGAVDAVDDAVSSGKRNRTSRSLMAYRRQSIRITAQLRSDPELSSDALVRALSAAARAASDAKGQIEGGSSDSLMEIVKPFSQKAAKAEQAAADLTAKLQRGTEI